MSRSIGAVLDEGGDSIGVQHQECAHGQSRSMGGPGSRKLSKASRSSCGIRGRSLSRSLSHFSNFLLRGLKMTSPVSGSRRINTSSPSKRNSAGRRTAWLRPFLNSLAVCMVRLLSDGIYHDLDHLPGDLQAAD